MITTHVHKKTLKEYQFLFATNQAATKDSWEIQAVYLDGNGDIWSRPMVMFDDKFVEIK